MLLLVGQCWCLVFGLVFVFAFDCLFYGVTSICVYGCGFWLLLSVVVLVCVCFGCWCLLCECGL